MPQQQEARDRPSHEAVVRFWVWLMERDRQKAGAEVAVEPAHATG